MTESAKTGVFVGAALVLAVIAYVTSPSFRESKRSLADEGAVFPELAPDKVVGMDVVRVDDQLSLRLMDNQWVIPSHDNYPADPKERLAKTAGTLAGMVLDSLVAEGDEAHADLGVLDPEAPRSSNEDLPKEAVGTRIKLFGEDRNTPLADIIVGKEVEGKFGYRYVRIGGKERVDDRVFAVNCEDLEPSTKFADWIEDELVPRGTITKFEIQEKAAESGQFVPTISLSKVDTKWTLAGLAEGETTKESKASDLIFDAQGLRIADAITNPGSEILKLKGKGPAEQVIADSIRGQVESRGFAVNDDGSLSSTSTNIVLAQDDGLVYTLHLGKTRPKPEKGDKKNEEPGEKKEGKAEEENAKPEEVAKKVAEEERYVVVSVAFDESNVPAVKKPEILQEAPPAEEAAPAEVPAAPAEPSPPTGEEPEAPPAEPKEEEPTAPPAETPTAPETPPASPDGLSNVAYTQPDPPSSEEATPPAEEQKPAESAAPEEAGEPVPASETPEAPPPPSSETEPAKAPDQAPDDPAKAAEEAKAAADEQAKQAAEEAEKAKKRLEEIKSAKERYEADLKAREEKVKAGPDKVKELQAKYSKWIYLVANDKVSELLVKREDLVNKPEPPAEPQTPPAEPGPSPETPDPMEKEKEPEAPAPAAEAPEAPAETPAPPAETPMPTEEPSAPAETPNAPPNS